MISASELFNVFGTVLDWLKTATNYRQTRDDRCDAALLAVYAAACETKSYVATLKTRRRQDQDRERQLSELWYKAAVKIRRINPDLARRCLLKSDYWADPTEWSEDKINEARISLRSIIDETRKLL